MQRALSAPGKLFLCGEYSVLWGGTALVAAVGPRASALVRRRNDRDVKLLLEEGSLSGAATPLGSHWSEQPKAAFHVAARTIDLALRAFGREALGFELALTPTASPAAGLKFGLGSSARAAVLTAEAVRFILEARFDALKLALLAHSVAQNGVGSGADVAASFAGGIVRYRRYELGPLLTAANAGQLASALEAAAPVDLWRLPPAKVHLGYVFTGQSASTPVKIADVERGLRGADRASFVRSSEALCQHFEDALLAGNYAELSRSVEGLQKLLSGLPGAVTQEHERLVALARSVGCAAKLSGAGGGDGCLVLAPDEEVLAKAMATFSARGFIALPMTPEPGLRGEPSAEPLLASWLS